MRRLTQEEIFRILNEPNVNKKKDIVHQLISNEYSESLKRGISKVYITLATGVGKTYWASQLIKRINQKNPNFTIGIVVPTTPLRDAFQAYVDNLSLKNVYIYVINSYTLSNKVDRTHDVLFVDELQHAAGDSKHFSQTIPISSAKAVIGLTATLKKTHHKNLQQMGLVPIFDLNIDEARLLGITPDFQKFNVPIELTTEEKAEYAKHQTEYEKQVDYFSKAFDSPTSVLFTLKGNSFQRDAKNLALAAERLEISEGQVLGIAKKWFEALQARNKILQQAVNGKKLVIELNNRLKGKTINFLKDIAYAEEINRQLESSVVYHSKLTKKQAKTALSSFEGDVQRICTVNALDEGYDLPTITYGINQGYDSSEIRSAQRIGRCVRFDELNPNKIPAVFFLYVADFEFMGKKYKSQQLSWLRNAQQGMTGVVWVRSIDECFNEETYV